MSKAQGERVTCLLEEYWQDDDRCYIRSQDEDELIDRFSFNADDSLSEVEAEEKVKLEVNKLSWTEAICVHIIP